MNQPPGFKTTNQPPTGENKPNIDDLLMRLLASQEEIQKQQEEVQKRQEMILKDHAMSIKQLEMQIGQIASSITSMPHGTLPSNTEANPKREHCNAVTLLNGRDFIKAFEKMEVDKEQASEKCCQPKTSEE
ncbi:hypothetical protein MLD38_024358 [Melastoma candidum]|uniref:Uncharacterized protein n=1 Tax=Melastoma candidum TaxID=119954 RepID=A0ACB9NTK3_9MYRT|nr:hypothetical protein MLD38_024358 [Melastoma candidum]